MSNTKQVFDALTSILRELQSQARPQPTLNGEAQTAADTYREIIRGLRLKYPLEEPDFEGKAISPTEIELQWVDPTNNADGYRIKRGEGGILAEVASFVPATARSYLDTGLSTGKTYDYQIVAFNTHGKHESRIIQIPTK